ncbi:helix-turn-helix domain-containing protein [Niveispirillum sp. KHB5.9]|uniref:helix-turn-helix domain-containing protein n=1 Tax=Niveispirillum sp. KHB5.9 TaxID=3400269 RepID=UPI003A87225D
MRDLRNGGGTTVPETEGTPVPAGPRHVGEALKARREALGYALPDLAASLRIRLNFLEAIEEGRWADLPGHAYSTGFLRSYAQIVGLDPGAVLLRFKQDAAGHEPAPELYFPEPVNESRVPGGAVLLIAALLAVGVYGGWYVLSASDRSVGDLVPALPERLSKLIYGDGTIPEPPPVQTQVLNPGQVEALVEGSSPSAPEVGSTTTATLPSPPAPAGTDAPLPATDTTPVAQGPATEEDSEVPQLPDLGQAPAPAPAAEPVTPDVEPVAAGEAPAAPAGPAANAAPAPVENVVPTGRVFGQADGKVRVTIRAVEDSWIEVRDAKGTLWASRVLRRGDLFKAPDVPGMVLNTGNAGGLVVSLDGRDLAPLGAKSQVMRSVPLAPEALAAR